ncbi:helix-turn-helix domain-containing protein [Nonomuraea fuscirosea]|uniref:helix-turn-helix domain-containing protein n=1 Tax=Nonomuraea fuscirosea TaxID=1291556 RepID=UPI0037B8D064
MCVEVVAQRVRQLITESGHSQGEFAALAGLDSSKMSKSLSGARRFTSLDLARIAEIGGVTVDWVLGADAPSALAGRLSSSPDVPVKDAAQEAGRLTQLRADLAFLGYKQHVTLPRAAPMGNRWVGQGQQLAAWARDQACGAGVDPSHTRDLAELIEDVFGIDVAISQMPDGFDGLACSRENSRLIAVGTSTVPSRQRFTLAHELGHALAGDDQDLLVEADIFDKRRRRASSEVRANAFATAFLLPEKLLKSETSGVTLTEESFAELVFRWWVSPSALAWRLHNLNVISRDLCDRFRSMTSASAALLAGELGSFTEWIDAASRRRTPRLLLRDTFQAYLDGNSTLRPFSSLIGEDGEALRRSLEHAGEEPPLTS